MIAMNNRMIAQVLCTGSSFDLEFSILHECGNKSDNLSVQLMENKRTKPKNYKTHIYIVQCMHTIKFKEDIYHVQNIRNIQTYMYSFGSNKNCYQIYILKILHDDNNRIERYNSRVLQSPHSATNCLQHVRSSGQGATVCKSSATHGALVTCNMSCGTQHHRWGRTAGGGGVCGPVTAPQVGQDYRW